MKQVDKLNSTIMHNVEKKHTIFSHQFHGASELGWKFSDIPDHHSKYYESLPKLILKNLPDKKIQIGSEIHIFKPEIIRYTMRLDHRMTLLVLVRYTGKDYTVSEDVYISIDSIEGLREHLESTHNDAHEKHGLPKRWGIIEEEGDKTE